MDNLILEHWNNKERMLPGIDCIAYPDGKVIILNCCSLYNPNTEERKLFCNPQCDTMIDSLEKYDAAYWAGIDEWTIIPYQGGKICGGGGTMGNQGFIACTDDRDNLLWGMFFENTNPIKSLTISGKTLTAVNEHAELQIEIDLDELTDIKMFPMANR